MNVDAGGITDASVGKSKGTSRPNPNARAAATSSSGASWRPIMANVVLHDSAKALASEMVAPAPQRRRSKFRIVDVVPGRASSTGFGKVVPGPAAPVSSTAVAVMILKVEPGA